MWIPSTRTGSSPKEQWEERLGEEKREGNVGREDGQTDIGREDGRTWKKEGREERREGKQSVKLALIRCFLCS